VVEHSGRSRCATRRRSQKTGERVRWRRRQRIGVAHTVLGKCCQRAVRIGGDVVAEIDRVQAVDADQQHMIINPTLRPPPESLGSERAQREGDPYWQPSEVRHVKSSVDGPNKPGQGERGCRATATLVRVAPGGDDLAPRPPPPKPGGAGSKQCSGSAESLTSLPGEE